MDSWNSQKMLDKYIHDYFVKKGMRETAEAFASEADVGSPTDVANQSPEGYLEDWWDVFYGMFSSNQAKHAQESYAEVARTIDNVAHNVSHVVPAFSAERSQEQCHLRTPEDEVTSNLRSLEIDRPSQRAPFVTDSSHPMEQIPNMPQQLEPRDEGEERGIYFEQTLPMEPNSDAHKKAMLLVPDLSEAATRWIRFQICFNSGRPEMRERDVVFTLNKLCRWNQTLMPLKRLCFRYQIFLKQTLPSAPALGCNKRHNQIKIS